MMLPAGVSYDVFILNILELCTYYGISIEYGALSPLSVINWNILASAQRRLTHWGLTEMADYFWTSF